MKDFVFISSENLRILQFDIKPIDGFAFKPNYPHCCEFHKQVEADAIKWFNEFPDCCEEHKKLKDSKLGFRKDMYDYAVQKILHQLAYSEFVIEQRINNDDWLQDIIDYLEYNFMSFGQPNVGYDIYENALQGYIKGVDYIPEDKKAILLNVFNYNQNGNKQSTSENNTDIKKLIGIYQRWLALFPFTLPFFKNVKSLFENNYPIIDKTIGVNRYTSIAKSKLISEEKLVLFLFSQTRDLLKAINTIDFYQQASIDDSKKIKLGLLSENHRVVQESLFEDFSKGEKKYLKIIKQWLKNEKIYFKEYTQIVTSEDAVLPKQKSSEQLLKELENLGFLELPSIKNLSAQSLYKLLDLLISNPIPYKIAMLSHIGFLEKAIDYTKTKYALCSKI